MHAWVGVNSVAQTSREHEHRRQLPRHPRDVICVLGLAGALRLPLQLLDGLPDGILGRVGAVGLLPARHLPLQAGAAATQLRGRAVAGGGEDELGETVIYDVQWMGVCVCVPQKQMRVQT